jgi:very-short-patch-repair endonuclease
MILNWNENRCQTVDGACSGPAGYEILPGMTLEQHMMRLGGVATRTQLIELTSRKTFERAVAEGRIVRNGRGRYSLPFVDDGVKAAHSLSGAASHLSAAGHWGWAMKTPPARPCVTVPRKRAVSSARRSGVDVTWSDLCPEDVDGKVTSVRRTLVDCLRRLPFDEALCIADSALRCGALTKEQLTALAAGVRGAGAARVRAVASFADGRAANPFESCLRAIGREVAGLDLVPQHPIDGGRLVRHPDLADPGLRLVVEAESFEWHGKRAMLTHDCERYNAFTLLGWAVIRFSWEHVMLRPHYVAEVLNEFVRRTTGRSPRHAM